MRAPPLPFRSSDKAAALIIVLAFVVLLAGLALAYFSRVTTDRQIGQSSYNDTSADLLARSALDIVVGDFQQEIITGSSSPAPYISGTKIYIPVNAQDMVPQRSGNLGQLAPNLIRRSVNPDRINAPGLPSRASAVNSTTASANGRFISLARWNRHYLIPRSTANPTPSPDDTTPDPAIGFTAPDWVIVTRRAGPTPFASWDATLANPTSDNYAVGRYAYAVYDEGGLLDINVAGYPTPVPATPVPEYLVDIGRKGVLAWADLTALASPSGTPFTNKIVGVRNYATVGQSNTTNWGFSFLNTPHISNFIQYFLGGGIGQSKIGTSRDFGAVNPIIAPSPDPGRTDQNFVTRAELINFFKTAYSDNVAKLNMLQYLGTFSREKNQPTLPLTPAWPSTWPRVVLPQRFYLGNMNLVVYPSPTPTPFFTPTPTASPTLTPPTIQTNFGLRFVSAASPTPTPPPPTPTGTPTPSPCIGQVRWEYVGATPNATATPSPLPYIPAFPSDPSQLTTLDFFQYINYALFGRTDNDSDDIAYTLGIGAALLDLYDADGLLTGIYYGGPGVPCSGDPGLPSSACLVYGAEQNGSNVRTQVPTCIAAPTPPDTFSSSFVPPVNTPVRTVGDFGWAYSILNAASNPLRNNTSVNPKFVIDFKDPYAPAPAPSVTPNPDPALLDFFTYNNANTSPPAYQGAPVRSGVVSLNTRQVPVLTAILSRTLYQGSQFPLTPVTASPAANTMVNDATNGTIIKPAMSRADIARLASAVIAANISPFAGATANQDIQDSIARALSETTQTRTWGLLIDVVAQTGHYAPNAQGLAAFVVEGEKRYWLHIAIDRFDGTIVGQQLEEVTE